jgi:hypothetical protein
MPFRVPGLIPDYSIGELIERAWLLRARCGVCRHEKRWPVAELRTAFPAEATLLAICAKLTCSACGSDEGLLDVLQDNAETSRRDLARVRREEREGKR